MKHKIVKDPVFRSAVLFYQCLDGKEATKHIRKMYSAKTDCSDITNTSFDGFAGTCIELFNTKTGLTDWFVWIRDKNDWKTMVHEASHLTFRVLDKRGVKYNSDNDETWCYLHEFFIREFWHVMTREAGKK